MAQATGGFAFAVQRTANGGATPSWGLGIRFAVQRIGVRNYLLSYFPFRLRYDREPFDRRHGLRHSRIGSRSLAFAVRRTQPLFPSSEITRSMRSLEFSYFRLVLVVLVFLVVLRTGRLFLLAGAFLINSLAWS